MLLRLALRLLIPSNILHMYMNVTSAWCFIHCQFSLWVIHETQMMIAQNTTYKDLYFPSNDISLCILRISSISDQHGTSLPCAIANERADRLRGWHVAPQRTPITREIQQVHPTRTYILYFAIQFWVHDKPHGRATIIPETKDLPFWKSPTLTMAHQLTELSQLRFHIAKSLV